MLCKGIVLALCTGFVQGLAYAKPWWSNPALKYDEQLVNIYGAVDPHYMNKDESDQYLAFATGSGGGTVYLYSIPALIAATATNDAAPIASGTPAALYGNWKGGAISDDLRRIVTGNGVPLAVTINAGLPLTAPWTKDTTVFAITNNPSAWGMDGIDFSHTSEFLFSDVYNSGYRNRIVKWDVVNLNEAGLAFTTNTVFTTSLSRIRNVSDAYIGGIGLGQMHLYIQCNDGALYIYDLNADGKSVGALARQFTVAEMKTLLVGSPTINLGSSDRIRCLEFTNDERYAFLIHTPNTGNALLQVVWTKPGTIFSVR